MDDVISFEDLMNTPVDHPVGGEREGTRQSMRVGGNLIKRITRIPLPGGNYLPVVPWRTGGVQPAVMPGEIYGGPEGGVDIPLRPVDVPDDVPVEDLAEAQQATAPPPSTQPPPTMEEVVVEGRQTQESPWDVTKRVRERIRGSRTPETAPPPAQPGELAKPDNAYYRTRYRHWTNKGLSPDSADDEARADFMNRERWDGKGAKPYDAGYFASMRNAERRLQSDKESREFGRVQREDAETEREKQALIDGATAKGIIVLNDIETAILNGMSDQDRIAALDPANQLTYVDLVRQKAQSRLQKAYNEWITETQGRPESEWYHRGDDTPRGVTDREIREYSTIVPYFNYMRKGEEMGLTDQMPQLFYRMRDEPRARP